MWNLCGKCFSQQIFQIGFLQFSIGTRRYRFTWGLCTLFFILFFNLIGH